MEVIVYSADSCIYCKKQRDFLERQGIDFVEKDIRKSKDSLNEFKELEGKGTPLTIIKEDDEIVTKITGFNHKQLVQVLQL
ncbi:glutaredoxin family protein [Paraliobacillus zengyii]|uniref:glutaredoxin family protein n=1 Tax=Paraliobacillus zengyii TaxID=2213194 RepID=UPI000DD2EFBE|nr:glutaredoxin family protein [Paraliobacillus zengyii]